MAKAAAQDLRIAIFIDFENLVTRTGVTAETFDLQPTLDELLEKGRVIYRRAYCDWSRFAPARQNLHDHGVELIDVPPSTRTGKNGADIRLVVDALELAHQREHIDTFVIASGDSDFCPLAYKLRENNRRVIGVGMRDATSPLFVKACDDFMYIRTSAKAATAAKRPRRTSTRAAKATAPAPVVEPVAPPSPAPRPPAPRPPARTANSRAKKPQSIPQVAREVIAGILARSPGRVNPSFLKESIVRKQADFDVRDYGFSTFLRLLEALENEGMLRRERSPGGQWSVFPAA